jgi:hypothetical protein
MANTTWSKTYTDFVTATANKVVAKRFTDVISRASPFLAWMMDDGGVTGRMNGSRYVASITGNRIEEPIMTELNDTIQWYDGTDTFDTSEQNVGTVAIFDAKQLGGTVTISGKEKRRNAGKERTINLTKARTEQGLISMRNDLAVALFDDGTNTLMVDGIRSLCPNDRGVAVAYGDVAANTAFWLCQRSRSGTTYGDVGDFATNFRDYGKRLFHDCEEGGSSPDIHVVSQELQEAYESQLLPMERQASKKARDLGYDGTPMFMGRPVLWDRKHPDAGGSSHRWYMLNSEFLSLRYEPETNFALLGFQRPANADFITSPMVWSGALCTNSRRMHGIATGITGVT